MKKHLSYTGSLKSIRRQMAPNKVYAAYHVFHLIWIVETPEQKYSWGQDSTFGRPDSAFGRPETIPEFDTACTVSFMNSRSKPKYLHNTMGSLFLEISEGTDIPEAKECLADLELQLKGKVTYGRKEN